MADDIFFKKALEALKIAKKKPPEALTKVGNDKLFELRFQVQPDDYDRLRSLLRRYDRSPLLRRYEGRVPDRDRDQQKTDIEELRLKLRDLTSSLHWKPKLLEFVKPYYEALKACYETMDDSDSRKHLADILSVLAPTTSPGESLDYKLLGSTDDDLASWGPAYVIPYTAILLILAALRTRRPFSGLIGGIYVPKFVGSLEGFRCAVSRIRIWFSFLVLLAAVTARVIVRATAGMFVGASARMIAGASARVNDVYHQLGFQRLLKAIVYPVQHFFITLEATLMGHLNLVQAEVRYGYWSLVAALGANQKTRQRRLTGRCWRCSCPAVHIDGEPKVTTRVLQKKVVTRALHEPLVLQQPSVIAKTSKGGERETTKGLLSKSQKKKRPNKRLECFKCGIEISQAMFGYP
ncbi:hypothetical protein Tsubulata_021859 [Turnera subulata]|uniref:RPN1 N-terminal domain-containing protein n=1 Tax=Turnera subulata TaxID=218843 RepID=A0A9Q0JBY9_9ROSI|nr:hypothetical protein Tsubulata_021859 [Turnera subulata]